MKTCSKCNISKEISEYNFMKTKGRYMAECKDCFRKRVKKLRPKYKEYDKEYSKKAWSVKKNNPEYKEKQRNYHREYKRKRRKDPYFRAVENIRTYFYRVVTLKENSTFKYLGCSTKEFRHHLETQFVGDMSWENYGEYWEIDHIKGIENFDLSQEDNILECWNYKNLRPLTINENRTRRYGQQ